LETAPEAPLRSNIVIALGDLAFRFPNAIEPWTSKIYARLRDKDSHVRKNTMMVLTHLILNDMIKVKGQISEMAICLEDKDKRISDLAHLFFHELANKGNAIYNILPGIFFCSRFDLIS
jgi:condensin complex subunit 1